MPLSIEVMLLHLQIPFVLYPETSYLIMSHLLAMVVPWPQPYKPLNQGIVPVPVPVPVSLPLFVNLWTYVTYRGMMMNCTF